MPEEETKQEEQKTDEEILFPEAYVNGITVKPWSFGKLFKVSSMLENIINRVEDGKLDEVLSKDFISYSELTRLFTTLLSKEVLDIIATTIDKSSEEVEELDMETGVRIAVVIFQQNRTTIKNALAPLFEAMTSEKKPKKKKRGGK